MDYSSSFAITSSLGYVANYVDGPQLVFAGSGLLQPQSTSRVEYDHDSGNVNLSYDGSSVAFVATDRTHSSPFLFYQKPPESAVLNANTVEMSARYVTVVDWRTMMHIVGLGVSGPGAKIRTTVIGTPSRTNAPLPDFLGYSGRASIRGGIRASATPQFADISGGSQTVTWSYTPSNNHLSGFVSLYIVENLAQYQRGLLRASGQFDRATNSISGTLSDPENGFEGTFRGQIFGPNRDELAIVFEFSRASDRSSYVGHYIGRR